LPKEVYVTTKLSREQELTRSLRDSVNESWIRATKELKEHIAESEQTNTHVNDTLARAREVQKCADQLIILDRLILRMMCADHNGD